MKVRRLNRKRGNNKSKRWLLQSKKVEICNTEQANVISLLLFQVFAAIVNQYPRMRSLHMNCQILLNIS